MLCLLWPMSGAQQLTKTSMMNSSFSSGGDYLIRVCKIVKLMMCFDCLQFIYSNLKEFLKNFSKDEMTKEINRNFDKFEKMKPVLEKKTR